MQDLHWNVGGLVGEMERKEGCRKQECDCDCDCGQWDAALKLTRGMVRNSSPVAIREVAATWRCGRGGEEQAHFYTPSP
jgi:hypothetical protein